MWGKCGEFQPLEWVFDNFHYNRLIKNNGDIPKIKFTEILKEGFTI